MEFNEEEGLIGLTEWEKEVLGEPRLVIDYRVAPFLHKRARRLAHACSSEYERLYFDEDKLTSAERAEEMEAMERRERRLRDLTLRLADVADRVELETVIDTDAS